MMTRATIVVRKFVPAMKQLTRVEFLKPTISKIEEEKYIKALKPTNCWMACNPHAIIRDLLLEGRENSSVH